MDKSKLHPLELAVAQLSFARDNASYNAKLAEMITKEKIEDPHIESYDRAIAILEIVISMSGGYELE